MKKFFAFLIASLVSISAFAYEYTAQCKMNSSSYVVASQDDDSKTVYVVGYGEAENCTVVVTVQLSISKEIRTFTVHVRNGKGQVDIRIADHFHLVKVDNIVCNSN